MRDSAAARASWAVVAAVVFLGEILLCSSAVVGGVNEADQLPWPVNHDVS